MCKIVLSPKQQEIANYINGPLLVTASAGSGKTRVLTERIANLTRHTRRRILAPASLNRNASNPIKKIFLFIDFNY